MYFPSSKTRLCRIYYWTDTKNFSYRTSLLCTCSESVFSSVAFRYSHGRDPPDPRLPWISEPDRTDSDGDTTRDLAWGLVTAAGEFFPELALFADVVGERGLCLLLGERGLVTSGEGMPPEVGGDEDTGRGILLGVLGDVIFSGVRAVEWNIKLLIYEISGLTFSDYLFLLSIQYQSAFPKVQCYLGTKLKPKICL